ncbi:MAG: glucokinase [Helicobacteraceae bacterium CG2_30_36_10]|nr:MAG: glucokinase [Helicobacteraceae bacterium CG2_30_36_10]
MILAGDIGGTKTNLALYEIVENKLHIKEQHQFASSAFSTFSDVIAAFKTKINKAQIEAACFGIAGPVINANCHTTNLPWEITTSGLQKELGTKKVHLLNDLEATAYGMLYLSDDEFLELNPHAKAVEGNRAVIAAGTGLGEALLYYDKKAYHPLGSEGGHTDFAPLTTQQDKLLKYLRREFPQHVSYERILSGPGIYTLYKFLSQSGFAPEPEAMLNLKEGKDPSAQISESAIKQNDPLCLEVLRLFVEIYGAEAGNIALKSMSLGGVYIGGGIAPKILPMLAEGNFMKAFRAKGRFSEMLGNMQVRVSLNQETALLGAAHFTVDKLL